MSFSSTLDKQDNVGGVRAIYGTYNAASTTTGTITVPLQKVLMIIVDAGTSSPSLPYWTVSGTTITITGLTSSQTGRWMAIGY